MNDNKAKRQVFSGRNLEGQKTDLLGAEWIPYSFRMASMVP